MAPRPQPQSSRIVAQPNDWQKAVRRQTGLSETAQRRHEFFEGVLDSIVLKRPALPLPKVAYNSWIDMASGPFGRYALSFSATRDLRAEVYLDTGDQVSTKGLFDELAADKTSIEESFGAELSWERLDNHRASRVGVYRPAPDLEKEDDVAEARDWAVTNLLRLIDQLDARLRKGAVAFRGAGNERPAGAGIAG